MRIKIFIMEILLITFAVYQAASYARRELAKVKVGQPPPFWLQCLALTAAAAPFVGLLVWVLWVF